MYPAKPKTGIRATHPNEYWHIDVTVIRLVLAQVEVSFGNSMIEAFWRSLCHPWLYLHSLESFAQLEQLIDFYVKEQNTQMPHHASGGPTPD